MSHLRLIKKSEVDEYKASNQRKMKFISNEAQCIPSLSQPILVVRQWVNDAQEMSENSKSRARAEWAMLFGEKRG